VQTWFVPQPVPPAAKNWSAQTGAPVPHRVVPEVAHGFVGVQAAPCVQAVQTPEGEQTWFVPQSAPGVRKVPSVQTGVPVAQAMVAVDTQGLLDAHSAPCVHALQRPALHTWFAPQVVPFATGTPATQVAGTGGQDTVPVRHGFAGMPGMQDAPELQTTHCPVAVQYWFGPQGVPAGAGVPVSVQTGLPEAQEMAAPDAQGFEGVQAAPSVQVLQTPVAEQTSPAPQAVPAGWLSRSVHTATPLEHS